MDRYYTPLIIIRHANKVADHGFLGDSQYQLYRSYRVRTSLGRLMVPKGTKTDFASVPQLLRFFAGRVGPWTEASIVHDAAYRNTLVRRDPVNGRYMDRLTRKESDEAFLELMTAANVFVLRKYLLYWAVRLFGMFAYQPSPDDQE